MGSRDIGFAQPPRSRRATAKRLQMEVASYTMIGRLPRARPVHTAWQDILVEDDMPGSRSEGQAPGRVARPRVMDACIGSIMEAEVEYVAWTGTTMRSAPESFLQFLLAQKLHKMGLPLRLEVAVATVMKAAGDSHSTAPRPRNYSGRFDLVVYYKSTPTSPRFIIELKKIGGHGSLNDDADRVSQVLARTKSTLQDGILVAYTTARKMETVVGRIEGVKRKIAEHLLATATVQLVRQMGPVPVMGVRNQPMHLGAAILRVSRPR